MPLVFEIELTTSVWTDYSGYVDPRTLSIKRQIKGHADQLNLKFRGVPLASVPTVVRPVRLRDTGGGLLFAGFITENRLEEEDPGVNPLLQVTPAISGLLYDFDRRLVRQGFSAGPAGARIRTIVTNIVNQDGGNYQATTATVPDGPTIPGDVYEDSISEAFRRIAGAADFDWWLDYDRVVHFTPRTDGGPPAPWSIDDDAQITHPVVTISASQIRNHVEIIGGTIILPPMTEGDFAENWLADGTVFGARKLAYGPLLTDTFTLYRAPDGVGTINEATDGQLVGVEGSSVDPTSINWLINYQTGTLRFTGGAGGTNPTSGTALRARYRYVINAIASDEDSASVAEFGRFDHLERDDSIESVELAMAIAARHLAQMAQPQRVLTFTTHETGLVAGQAVEVHLPTLGLTSERGVIRSSTEKLIAPATGPLTLHSYLWQNQVEVVLT